jgi:hypothetical protein
MKPLPGKLAVLPLLASLASCEAMQRNWERSAEFYSTPQGQALLVQSFQQQRALSQQNYQFEQNRLLREQELRLERARLTQPVKVEHSGGIDVHHSGSIRVRR